MLHQQGRMKCCLTVFAFMSTYDLHGAPCCYRGRELQWENQTVSAAYWFFLLFFFSSQWKSFGALLTSVTLRASPHVAPVPPAIATWSHPLPLPLYLPLQALPGFYFLLAILSCQFTNHGLQDACLPELLYIIANPTHMEYVHLYRDFVVLHPLFYFPHQNQQIQKVMLFQTYIA